MTMRRSAGMVGRPDLRWGGLLIAGACFCWAIGKCVKANLDELAPSHITFVKGVNAGGANLATDRCRRERQRRDLVDDGFGDQSGTRARRLPGRHQVDPSGG